jgi:hypothetical protein
LEFCTKKKSGNPARTNNKKMKINVAHGGFVAGLPDGAIFSSQKS